MILKPKRHVHYKFRDGRKQVKTMTTPEPHKMVFIGALDVDRGETVTLNIPPDADAATVRSAIEAANAERAAKQAQESEALEKLFLNKVAIDKDGEK